MIITWLGHACFAIEEEDYRVILDPYAPGSVPGLASLAEAADLVLCSHGHSDHNAAEEISLRTGDVNPFTITCLDTWHDDKEGALRGTNKITILEANGVKVVHMGDIGCPLTEDQLAAVKGADVLLIPIGGYYTIGPKEADEMADAIGARITVPMHYRSKSFGYPVIGTVDEFTRFRTHVRKAGITIDPADYPEPVTLLMRPKYAH